MTSALTRSPIDPSLINSNSFSTSSSSTSPIENQDTPDISTKIYAERILANLKYLLSNRLTAALFDKANRSDCEQASLKLNECCISAEDSKKVIRDIFEGKNFKKMDSSSPHIFNFSYELNPTIHLNFSSKDVRICEKNKRSSTEVTYKITTPHQQLVLSGSSLRPFGTMNVSPVVQIRPLPDNENILTKSINKHELLQKALIKKPLDFVYLPEPPTKFSTTENIFFQPSYRLLEDDLQGKKINFYDQLTIFFHVGRTLQWMHALRVVHNDVKSSNVFYESNPDRNREPDANVIGLLNNFGFTRNYGRSVPISKSEVTNAHLAYEKGFGSLCAIFKLSSPLNDWCNFAQMVYQALDPLKESGYYRLSNYHIFLRAIESGGTADIPVIKEDPEAPPLTRLQTFFRKAFLALAHENAYFFLKILGKEATAELQTLYKEAK